MKYIKGSLPPLPLSVKDIKSAKQYLDGLREYLSRKEDQLVRVLNLLRVDENFDSEILSISDTGTADTEFSVPHNLGRIPLYFFIIDNDKGGVLYRSSTSWTDTAVYFKDSAANALIKVVIF